MAEVFANNVAGELASSIASGDTSISLSPGHNFPDPGSGNFLRATIEQNGGPIEIVFVTAVSGDTLTVERGKENTSASSFSAGVPIEHRWTAGAAEDKLDYRDTLRILDSDGSSLNDQIGVYDIDGTKLNA